MTSIAKQPNDLVGYVTWTDAFCLEHWQDELSEDVQDAENVAFALSHGNLEDDEYAELGKEGSGVDLEYLYHVALVDTGSAFPRERADYYSYEGELDDEYCARCGIALADYEDKEVAV